MSSTVMREYGVVKSPTCVSSCGSCACKKACGEPEAGVGLMYALASRQRGGENSSE